MGQQFNRMSAALGSSQPADASVNDKDWGWLEGVDLDAYITGAQAGGGGGSSPSGAPRPEAGAAAAAGPSSSSSPPDGGTSGPSSSSKLKDIGEFLQAKLQLRKDARQDLMSQVGVFSYLRVQIVNKLRPRQTFETYCCCGENDIFRFRKLKVKNNRRASFTHGICVLSGTFHYGRYCVTPASG